MGKPEQGRIRSVRLAHDCVLECSVMSDSLWLHGRQHFRLHCPNFPGKNTGVGCHFLLQVLPNPGIKPHLLHLLYWQVDYWLLSPLGNPRGLVDVNNYVQMDNNNILLYSTGNYIQYSVINHKEYEKNTHIHTYITESLYCITEINTTL